MINKKILVSFLLVFLIALSVASVSAEDATDVVATDDVDSEEIVATDDVEDVISVEESTFHPTNNTFSAVEDAVKLANKSGDTVDLSNFAEYDFTNNTLAINNDNIKIIGNGSTVIKGVGIDDGIIGIYAKNVTIKGIKFVDTAKQDFVYGGTVSGYAISVISASNAAVSECEFVDFNSALNVKKSSDILVENSNFVGGYTTLIYNDPMANKEKGSKVISVGNSNRITIRGNNFTGPMLDAVTIYSGSGSNIIENNIFINNTYSIYFGGASSKNSLIKNNTFINCGEFKKDNQSWERLPVISLQKSSDDVIIVENTFVALENNILIAAEQGNTAHGFPTSLKNIRVTDNTVKTDYVNNASAVVLFHVLVREGVANFTNVTVSDNTLNGATQNITWLASNGNEYPLTPTANTFEAVQKALDTANPGDIVDLSNFAEYDFGNNTLSINKNNIKIIANGATTIKGLGIDDGIIGIYAENVTVKGIKFVDTAKQDFVYGGTVSGYAISVISTSDAAVSECEFVDFNSAVNVKKSSYILVENSNFVGGYTTLIYNDPMANKEKGSKVISVGNSNRITIRGNNFTGPMLDAVTIYSGSGSNIIENNIFVNNTYSIYFGGASSKNSLIKNNTFINCGEFKKDNQYWERLPVISLQKSSDYATVVGNTFVALENNILIAAEQGNTAHGFPTSLKNIAVTDNTVDTAYVNNASAVVLFHVLVREGEANFTNVTVSGNTLNGATENITWLASNGREYPVAPTSNTTENVQKAIDDTAEGDVLDLSHFDTYDFGNDTVVFSKDITLKGNGNTVLKGNDIIVKGDVSVTIDGIKSISLKPAESVATKFNATDVTVTEGDSGNLQISLLDDNGIGVARKTFTIIVNGETSNLTTDSNGVATFAFKYDAPGTYYATFTFLGDVDYKASAGSAKITVKAKEVPPSPPAPIVKKTVKITAKKKTFKVKTKTKKYTVTLKASGKAVKNVQVTLKVKGKTIKAKTNAKGKATFKIKNLKKKGKFTAIIKFKGDKNYKAASSKVKLTVK